MNTKSNSLLSKLAREDAKRLEPLINRVPLRQGQVLHDAYEPIEYIYFLESGMSSEIALDAAGERIEVGCIGREGLIGVPALLGVESTPHRSFMETAGEAHRIKTPALLQAMDDSDAVRTLLLKFVHVFMIQVAATALADGRYSVDQRTARWLLMSHDRLDSDELPLTHDFLSLMLGVRRSSVTNALHALEGMLAIRANRGRITVRDRTRLEEIAGGCYGVPEREYVRVLGSDPRRPR